MAVSTRRRGRSWIDAHELSRLLGDLAEVVLLETGDATWELTDALPARLDVYGGAARIWWPGLREDSDPYDHRLYFIHSPADAPAVQAAIVNAIKGARATGDQPAGGPTTGARAPVVKATVTAVEGSRVQLATEIGTGELSYADAPIPAIAQCLKVGLVLDVRPIRCLDDGRCQFSIQGLVRAPWDVLVDAVAVGDVVTGRVRDVRDYGVIVEVLPHVTGLVHISEVDWTYVKDIAEFVKPGDLV